MTPDPRLPYTPPTVTRHPANEATTAPLSEHEVIDTIWRTLKADGWQAIGNGRWQKDGRIFDPHKAVLLPAWRYWHYTGKLVTTEGKT